MSAAVGNVAVREPAPPAPAATRPAAGRPGQPPAWFRPDVQGLRAVAILLVVLYHAGVPPLSGGYVGVDVFFVVSGFVITAHLDRESRQTGRVAVGRFYVRRAMRLLPALTLVTGCTLVAAWYWLPSTRWREIGLDALSAAGYVVNYRLIQQGADYRTATAAPSPLEHFWSLAVEEQFYLVLPLLLMLTLVLLRRRVAFVALVAVLVVGSFGWSVVDTGRSAVAAYYGAPTRGWELGVGVLVAMAGARVRGRLPGPAATGLRWAGLAAIVAGAVLYGTTTPFPGYRAALPVLGAAAVIVAGSVAGPGRVLVRPLLGFIGARSYSWYLWHWPVLLIAPFALSRELDLRDRLIAVGASLVLAAWTFVAVEQPIRLHPLLLRRSWLAGLTAVALTAGTAAGAILLTRLPERLPLGLRSVAAVSIGGGGTAGERALARELEAAAARTDLPANLTPSLAQAPNDDPAIYRDGCFLIPVEAVTTPTSCQELGDGSSRAVVVLYGDSHAAQWFPALDLIAHQRHWRLAVFSKAACSAADVEIYLPRIKRPYTECATWRTWALARIRALHPAVVVTSSNADGGDPWGVKGSADQAWARAWSRTIAGLRAPGTRIVYLNDTPWPKQNVPDCLARHPRNVPLCAQAARYATSSPRRTAMAASAAAAGAPVVDPMPWFCTLATCPVVVGNVLVYHDDSHLTQAYARLLAPLLAEHLGTPSGVVTPSALGVTPVG